MSKDFSGWDFGRKGLNAYVWFNPETLCDYGQRTQELIERVLPDFRTTGDWGFLDVFKIRRDMKTLDEAGVLEQHEEWLEGLVRYVFDVDPDPNFGESYVPEPIAEQARKKALEKMERVLPDFNTGLTMQEMLADFETGKTEMLKWKDLMKAPYEIK